MGNTKKPDVTKEELEHAQAGWVNFTKFLLWGTLGTIGIVVFLALVTL